MSGLEFAGLYLLAGGLAFLAGVYVGRSQAETEADRVRRWWMERELRSRKERVRR
jgi:hypothetical protein